MEENENLPGLITKNINMSKHSRNYTFSKNSKSGSSGGDSISNQSKHGVFRPNINNGGLMAGTAGFAGGGASGTPTGTTTGCATGFATGTTTGTTTNSACSGLKNTNSILSKLSSFFSKHFEYDTCEVNTTKVRPMTLGFLDSDDEIDEGVLVKSSNACTNSIKLWKNSSFMSKTTASPPRRSPNTVFPSSDDRDVRIIENGIKILLPTPPNNNTLQVAGKAHTRNNKNSHTSINPFQTSFSYHGGMSTALILHSPIDKSFKQDRFDVWLETQKLSVKEGLVAGFD